MRSSAQFHFMPDKISFNAGTHNRCFVGSVIK
jgi:hypothetical protein